jgi:hypothetical protein
MCPLHPLIASCAGTWRGTSTLQAPHTDARPMTCFGRA